jgi:hypothetical protein
VSEGLPAPEPWSGFTKIEVLEGPPLSYIAEKLSDAIRAAHRAYQASLEVEENPTSRFRLRSDTWHAFRYSLIAYLALHNHAVEERAIDSLAEMETGRFEDWLGHLGSWAT